MNDSTAEAIVLGDVILAGIVFAAYAGAAAWSVTHGMSTIRSKRLARNNEDDDDSAWDKDGGDSDQDKDPAGHLSREDTGYAAGSEISPMASGSGQTVELQVRGVGAGNGDVNERGSSGFLDVMSELWDNLVGSPRSAPLPSPTPPGGVSPTPTETQYGDAVET